MCVLNSVVNASVGLAKTWLCSPKTTHTICLIYTKQPKRQIEMPLNTELPTWHGDLVTLFTPK